MLSRFITALCLGVAVASAARGEGTSFGVLPGRVDNGVSGRLKTANAIGVSCVRMRIIMQDWNGGAPQYDGLTAAGLRVILDVDFGRVAQGDQKVPVEFSIDLPAYKKTLSSILESCKPELVVIENEPLNPTCHKGSMEHYLAELDAAIEVAHAQKLKVTDGGLTAMPRQDAL